MNVEIEDIFSMDVDGEHIPIDPEKVEAEYFSRTLDVCLRRIFIYMKTTCYNPKDDSLM